MYSMKKVLLLACMAGSMGLAHAGVWQNFTNSCSGFYSACAKSLNDNASALSTNACNAYAYCINTTSNNAKELANSVSTRAATMREGVVNTASAVKNTTVQVTAPVVQPIVSVAKTGASTVANMATFTYENPKLVSSVALAATAAYLAYCRNNTHHWYPTIEAAKQITSYVDPIGELKDWRVINAKDQPALSIQDILTRPDVYNAFKKDKGHSNESHDAFIDRMLQKLKDDMATLKPYKENLKKYCLGECRILPSLKSQKYHEANNFVDTLISKRIEALRDSERFIDLSDADVNYINQQVNQKVATSYFNPLKVVRQWALPYEAQAIEQYWMLTKSIERLEALKNCLQNKRVALNSGN